MIFDLPVEFSGKDVIPC